MKEVSGVGGLMCCVKIHLLIEEEPSLYDSSRHDDHVVERTCGSNIYVQGFKRVL